MQRLYDFRAVTTEDFPQLKAMWRDIFGDSEKVVDNFFRETAQTSNILCAFYGNEPVSVLYLLDSVITVEKRDYRAYYVYGACTRKAHRGKGLMKQLLDCAYEKAFNNGVDYLYLVPAEETLFDFYGENGYRTGFCYTEVELDKSSHPYSGSSLVQLTYDDLIKYRYGTNGILANPSEKMFNSFYYPAGDDIKVICVEGEGYGVCELCDGKYIVHEVFGCENTVINCIFDVLNCDTLVVRKPVTSGNGKPCGMYKNLGDAPEILNGFFGIPYGG